MSCPFLKETRVKYCQSASVRKMIPLPQAERNYEKCSTADYATCPVYQAQNPVEAGGGNQCPYRRESLMQFCGATPVSKFVPYSESLLSRCGNDGHRYCELYQEMAHPEAAETVNGIAMPGWLKYSRNHMWLDSTGDGLCHIGADAFLARALGRIDRVSFVWNSGVHRPAVNLSAAGSDFHLIFPNAIQLTGCNLHLRAQPDRISSDPYCAGWLFEGRPGGHAFDGLLQGEEARRWMEQEERRMSEFLQSLTARDLGPLAADGGMFSEGVATQLEPEQVFALSLEFFSPYAGERSEL